MDFQVAIMSRLLADTTITALVGGRISWVSRPQGWSGTAIVLQVISDPRTSHLKGFDGARHTLLQCDCWAPRYADAVATARAVIACLAEPAMVKGKKFGNALVDGQRDLGESVEATDGKQTFVHRQSVDLRIWHVGD